jgi:2-oxo-3-hexenedioate decarboxylase
MAGDARLARALLEAMDTRQLVACPSEAGLDLTAAYGVAAEITGLRAARGERLVGRKIGFTNRLQWPAFGAEAPIWGVMYQTSVRPIPGSFALGTLREPKLEPEIVFRLGARPLPEMDASALMACVSHLGHAFEIVQSPYPGWRFRAADAVAAAGLHAALLHGPLTAVGPAHRDRWRHMLADFRVTLSRDGAIVAEGSARSVLDAGPLAALAQLVQIVAADPIAPPLEPGELISTGSLTGAVAVATGETWTTELSGLPLDGLRVGFVSLSNADG